MRPRSIAIICTAVFIGCSAHDNNTECSLLTIAETYHQQTHNNNIIVLDYNIRGQDLNVIVCTLICMTGMTPLIIIMHTAMHMLSK